jgi:hypothetical protein
LIWNLFPFTFLSFLDLSSTITPPISQRGMLCFWRRPAFSFFSCYSTLSRLSLFFCCVGPSQTQPSTTTKARVTCCYCWAFTNSIFVGWGCDV